MRDLRDALHEAAPSPRGRLDLGEAVRRGRVLAWQQRAAVALLSLISCGAVWIVATSLPSGGQEKRPFPAESPPPPSHRRSCSDEGLIRENQATGTVITEAPESLVEIASGEHQGREWFLCAYVEKTKKLNQPPKDHLCVGARFGAGPFPGYECLDLEEAGDSPRSDYLLGASGVVKKEGGALHYGVISQRVRRVVLRPSGGTEIEASTFERPEKLGVDYNFFVGFAPLNVDVTVSVKDGAGRELDRHLWKG